MKSFQNSWIKKNIDLIFIVLISTIPLLSFFSTSNLPHTHDGLVHLPRMAAFYKALLDFQIPVRWAGDLNYGYGLPLFNFIYHFPYLVSSVFIFLGFGLVNSFKLTLGISFILSGVFMYYFTKEFFQDNKRAVLVSVFYQFFPFRFVEILMRGSFGEVYAYVFLPLILYGSVRISKKINFLNILIISSGVYFLIISHNSVSLLFFGISLLFNLFFLSGKYRFWAIASLFFGLCLASYYWIPAIVDHKYTYGDLFMKNIYMSHFPPLFNFFIPNLTNQITLSTEGIPVQIGAFHVLGILLSIVVLFKRGTKIKKIIYFSLFLTFVSLFLMQPVSKFFWEKISLLRQFQFPWRILSVISFSSSLSAISYLEFRIFNRRSIFYLLILFVIVLNCYYFRPLLGEDKISEKYYWNFPLNTTYYGETDVIWSAGPAKSYPKSRVEVISGKGNITSLVKKSNLHYFVVKSKNGIKVVDHTEYFPGWKVFVNKKEVPVQFQDPNHRGELTFFVPRGINSVEVKFTETKVRLIADILSTLSFLTFIPLFIFKKTIK